MELSNMKVFIFTVLVLVQYRTVNCEGFFDTLYSKLNKLASSITNYFKDGVDKIVGFIRKKTVPDPPKNDGHSTNMFNYYLESPTNYVQMKDVFKDIVRKKFSNETLSKTNNVNTASRVMLSTPELSRWQKREMKSHVVETIDGYLLTLYRIKTSSFLQVNRTVLLHHGLLGSSTDWILLGSENSLPYILSDAGYDVWITNARGNYYSRGHLSKGIGSKDYWEFTWEQMGKYDLPAVIDYIRTVKNSRELINFIGHSMGASALLVLLSTFPEYNDFLRMGILLGPLAYMSNTRGPLKKLSSMSEEFIKLLGDGEFIPSRKVPSYLGTKYCNGPKIYCTNPLLFISGFTRGLKWNASFVARLMHYIPAGGSTNTVLHYMQLIRNRRFHSFENNEAVFQLSKVSLPIAIISSSDDWLATVPDVLKLYLELAHPIDHYIINDMNMSHTDLVWGSEARSLVFNKVLDYLEIGLSLNSIQSNEIL